MKIRQIILGTIFMLATVLTVSAQTEVATSTISEAIVEQGYNSSNALDAANESIDYITIGATNMPYWAMPDPAIVTTSTFNWSTTIGSIVASPANSNSARAAFPSTGSGVITVQEVSVSGCSGGAPAAISVTVIAVPTINIGASSSFSTCSPAALTITPVFTSAVTGTQGVTITYTVDGAGQTASLSTGGSFTVAAGLISAVGTHTIIITGISDRISRKSKVTVTPSAATNTFTYTVNPIPTTGKIYHLPNN